MNTRLVSILAAAAVLLAAVPGPPASGGNLLLKNGNLLTVSGPVIAGGDILILDGKIARIGQNRQAPSGVRVLDLGGQWIMPGIIDSHSHIAIEGGVNEMGSLMTPETDIRDVINPEDLYIFYALAGGGTTVHTMHGSAKPTGGRGHGLQRARGE